MTRQVLSRRVFLNRTLAGFGGVAALGVGAGSLVSCTRTGAGDTLQRAQEEGVIKVGIANEKPFGYKEGDKVTGQAPELARAIFKRLGIDTMQAETVTFDALPDSLNNETFDVIAAGMFITPERCDAVIFSNPDYCMQTALLILKGSPAEGAASFEDVAANPDIKLGTMGTGVVEYGWALESGVPEEQITPGFDDQATAVRALANGQIHALALTRLSLQTQLESDPNPNLELSEPFFPVIDGEEQAGCGGFGFRKSDTALRDAFNAELEKMQESGEVYEIVKPFGILKEEVDAAAEKTASSLCNAKA